MTQQSSIAPEASQHEHVQSPDDYYQSWLSKHESLIAGMQAAVLYLPIDGELISVASCHIDHKDFAELNQLINDNKQAVAPMVTRLASISPKGESFGLLYPILSNDNQLIAFAGFAVQVNSQEQLTQALMLLQWSAAGIEVAELQHKADKLTRDQQSYSERVEILARVLSEPNYGSSAVRMVTELAVLLNCDRVSLGEYKNKRARLKHLSHSAQFGKKMNHVRLIERVMDECIDQDKIIRFPNRDEDTQAITQAHQNLSSSQGDIGLISIPLYLRGEIYGALVVEGNPEQIWTKSDSELCQSIASLILPTLNDKRINDRSSLRKIWDGTSDQLGKLLGPKFLGRKLVVIVLIIVGYLLATLTGEYKLSTNATIESGVQRAIVAPFDGYINQALVRAGDKVRQGEELISMDDRDLRLERLKWLSEESKLVRQRLEALAVRDRAKLNILNAQEKQVQAQLALVESQIERGNLSAPYDGLIVSGDLSQRLGSAVTKGELLLEVAPLDSYRIKLQVQESRISDLTFGQKGTLYLSALPETGFEFIVTKITPVTEAIEGASYFIVEAEFDLPTKVTKEQIFGQLQPGMEGVGKIYIDERLLFHIWTRDLTEWLRLQAWSWWG